MKFKIKNVGKIDFAELEIKKISIIAGENNSGKSTIGKTLFSVFNSFSNINEKVVDEIMTDINRVFIQAYDDEYDFDTIEANMDTTEIRISSLLRRIVESIFRPIIKRNENNVELEDIKKVNDIFIEEISEIMPLKPLTFDSMVNTTIHLRLYDILKFSQVDVLNKIVSEDLKAELNNQVTNVYTELDSQIILEIKDLCSEIEIKDNNIVSIDKPLELNTQAVYLDDPFILDEVRSNRWRMPWLLRKQANSHRDFTIRALEKKKTSGLVERMLIDSKLEHIFSKINEVASGELIQTGIQGVTYREKNREPSLNAKNLSSGLKTFVIIKTLISNGTLSDNGTLILDEPEIHLHPEWQLLLAEVIVLIQKAFEMHILITTHSPYFMRAIEVYTEKYKISEDCKYYTLQNTKEKKILKDMTNNIDSIYEQLAQPFQDLENILYED